MVRRWLLFIWSIKIKKTWTENGKIKETPFKLQSSRDDNFTHPCLPLKAPSLLGLNHQIHPCLMRIWVQNFHKHTLVTNFSYLLFIFCGVTPTSSSLEYFFFKPRLDVLHLLLKVEASFTHQEWNWFSLKWLSWTLYRHHHHHFLCTLYVTFTTIGHLLTDSLVLSFHSVNHQ